MLNKFIIRQGLKRLAKVWNESRLEDGSYAELQQYGIADVLPNKHTGEPMFVIDGIKSPTQG